MTFGPHPVLLETRQVLTSAQRRKVNREISSDSCWEGQRSQALRLVLNATRASDIRAFDKGQSEITAGLGL